MYVTSFSDLNFVRKLHLLSACRLFYLSVTEWRRFLLALFRSDLVKQIVNDQTSKVQLFTEFITDILYVHDVSSL